GGGYRRPVGVWPPGRGAPPATPPPPRGWAPPPAPPATAVALAGPPTFPATVEITPAGGGAACRGYATPGSGAAAADPLAPASAAATTTASTPPRATRGIDVQVSRRFRLCITDAPLVSPQPRRDPCTTQPPHHSTRR